MSDASEERNEDHRPESDLGVEGTRYPIPSSWHQANEKHVSISVHDNALSSDILLGDSLFAERPVAPRSLLRLTPVRSPDSLPKRLKSNGAGGKSSSYFLFHACFATPEQSIRLPNLKLSLPQNLLNAWRLTKGMKVQVSLVESDHDSSASHVEVVFRDQYLARGDMWRFACRQLAGQCLYRGQKLEHMGTIRAVVNNIYSGQQKMHSAIYGPSTKPIFRSESARYVIFIQMSREMWEFDSEGTGEIMFDRVVSGFLPELFNRWQHMQVKHLVTIVLFTRMEYDSIGNNHVSDCSEPSPNALDTRDFYRVVSSDMASVEASSILERLKREFQTFLSDITLRKPTPGEYAPLGSGLTAVSSYLPEKIISGRPTAATRGNILEAINLASTQFSTDYIDRDLFRTGVSITLITPGSGLFEVDHKLLVATTETLTDNGIGIDLVCLSRMPLHSVPLFSYHALPLDEDRLELLPITKSQGQSNTMSIPSPSNWNPLAEGKSDQQPPQELPINYGIPSWIDISFFNSVRPSIAVEGLSRKARPDTKTKSSFDLRRTKVFRVRVRMYRLQMMGVAENSTTGIAIPPLSEDLSASLTSRVNRIWQNSSGRRRRTRHGAAVGSPIPSSRESGSGGPTPRFGASPCKETGINHTPGLFELMDEHDENVFRASRRNMNRRSYAPNNPLTRVHSLTHSRRPSIKTAFRMKDKPTVTLHAKSSLSKAITAHKRPMRPKTGQRNISFGPRGFGIASVSAAKPLADIQNVVSHDIRLGHVDNIFVPNANISNAELKLTNDPRHHSPERDMSDEARGTSTEEAQDSISDTSDQETSRPIPIGMPRKSKDRDAQARDKVRHRDRLAALQDVEEQNEVEKTSKERFYGPDLPTLSLNAVLAPWVTILNPCNPTKYLATARQAGKWQHVFPKAPKVSRIKWKSMCCPAAVPLTTEEFPTARQLMDEYRENEYRVTLFGESTTLQDASAHELLSFRLSRGFQIVVGPVVADTVSDFSLNYVDPFSEEILKDGSQQVWLSRGSVIHGLSRVAPNMIRVKTYFRHETSKIQMLSDEAYARYQPLIKSMLGNSYECQEITSCITRTPFNWEAIDNFISSNDDYVTVATQDTSGLRPWKARFVLIPFDSPLTARRPSRPRELTDEENRIEGIEKITQIWQRGRLDLTQEQIDAKVGRIGEDNPLDVQYFTKAISAVIADELYSANDDRSRTLQLLPESELFQRTNIDMHALADRLQGPKGVRILDRRWHMKIHHHCMLGSDLTTWLLENVRGASTREEAVDTGNELMSNGLFKHVERRHEFRDGHYFYQLLDEYRGGRQMESKSLFRWTKGATHSSTIHESQTIDARISKGLDTGGAISSHHCANSAVPSSQGRTSVALGKSLIFNLLQSRARLMGRDETVTVHYDRLHNPENCFHIRLEWLTATPKLIQDAVNHWSMVAEGYGLRMVEVPIGEASHITSSHPFRAPYIIKLAYKPHHQSKQDNLGNTPTSKFARVKWASEEVNLFQKQILGKFGFVLDFEAVSDYPEDVDATYSWGPPVYQAPQYIHRSGLLLAQITRDGDFSLLANRLYNNRSPATRLKRPEDQIEVQFNNLLSPLGPRVNPLKTGDALTQRIFTTSSNQSSPLTSPLIKAVPDFSSQSGSQLRTQAVTSFGYSPFTGVMPVALASPPSRDQHQLSQHQPHVAFALHPFRSTGSSPAGKAEFSTSSFPRPNVKSKESLDDTSEIDPEVLTHDLEEFCTDVTLLESFWADVLARYTPSVHPRSGSVTPATIGTPLTAPRTSAPASAKTTPMSFARNIGGLFISGYGSDGSHERVADDEIPDLVLPGSLVKDGLS